VGWWWFMVVERLFSMPAEVAVRIVPTWILISALRRGADLYEDQHATVSSEVLHLTSCTQT
jgi:hypothetical protein